MERGVLLVLTNPSSPDRVDEFNRWYDETHLKEVLQVPGVVGATRFELDEDQMLPGDDANGRRYLAAYELEAEDLKTVRDAINATSADRTHSDAMESDPLPKLMLFRQIGERIS